MPIIIKVGRLPEILWAIVTLAGFVLASSGTFNTWSGIMDLQNATNASSAAISQLSGGILMFCFGLVVIAAGYLGIRGKIVIIR
jgi:hypothetical protein